MRFGKPILPKATNLTKHRFSEFIREPLGLHTSDQPSVKLLNHPRSSPGRHRAAELIGFSGREAGGDDG